MGAYSIVSSCPGSSSWLFSDQTVSSVLIGASQRCRRAVHQRRSVPANGRHGPGRGRQAPRRAALRRPAAPLQGESPPRVWFPGCSSRSCQTKQNGRCLLRVSLLWISGSVLVWSWSFPPGTFYLFHTDETNMMKTEPHPPQFRLKCSSYHSHTTSNLLSEHLVLWLWIRWLLEY